MKVRVGSSYSLFSTGLKRFVSFYFFSILIPFLVCTVTTHWTLC